MYPPQTNLPQVIEAHYSYTQYPSHPMLNYRADNYIFDLQEEIRKQGETDVFALTSKLSCLGQRAQQLEQFFRSESVRSFGQDEQQQQQAKLSLNSVASEIIYTSASILSQLQILSNPHETPPKEEKAEIIKVNEEDILADHVHLCKICGKAFRRAGNVRIHMRSHGDQYKTVEALKSSRPKPTKSYKFSCPVEDCKRNKGHPNLKPLKSMVSLRNHYRRSHCPKMYSCNKCGKGFSFLSDLKTHENKCGHSSWRCSCNITFSTKGKLFRHFALYREGHKHAPSFSHAAPRCVEKPTSDGKSLALDYCTQDAHDEDLAPKDLSTLAEGPHGYGSDEVIFTFDTSSVGIHHSEYVGQSNEFDFLDEYREENNLYGSLFWSDEDLHWA